jgi:16S rRNA (guanine527-N7)-methyltransferase
MNFKEDINQFFGIEINSHQLSQFEAYYQFLIEYNEITNLTRIVEKKDVYYKHFYDSLSILKVIDFNQIKTICDMGSGAGFPSIPLKIIFPHLKVIIIDSLNKRINFLVELCKRLSLDHVELFHDRVEDYAKSHQNCYDIVTARALGNMRIISEMGIPMTKENGCFVAYKSLEYKEELTEAKSTIQFLGGSIKDIFEMDLPYDLGFRVLIKIKKEKHIIGYPRTYAQMLKKPLK